MPRKVFAPVVKLGEWMTYKPWKYVPCDAVVIRMEDLLLENGRSFSAVFDEIADAGSIHNYLNSPCKVMLSTIMRDKLVRRSSVDTYIDVIRTLNPDYYFTPDGETYEFEIIKASSEIERILVQSREIISKCDNSTPLGLVKGASVHQVRDHADSLQQLGVDGLVFHVGDFLCRGSNVEWRRARLYASTIKKRDCNLFIYGIGAGRNLNRFSFADGFMTQSHYINAFYGEEYYRGRWSRRKHTKNRENIMKNLAGIYSKVKQVDQQNANGGLNKWAVEIEETAIPVHRLTAVAQSTGQ